MSTIHSVYLVDDHPLVREWLSTLLSEQPDLRVCGEAGNALEARAGIERLQPDVVIVDIALPASSGLELLKEIRQIAPRSIALMLSMHDELAYAERALRAGARGYVSKSNTPRKIITAIRQVLEGKIYVSDEFKELMTERFLGASTGATAVPQLSGRELEVFRLLGQGRDTREIAVNLSISIKTVQEYCARIKEKLQLASHTELLRRAIRWCDSGESL
jgi:DNA-binding NarL/FixJ family response regulator